MSLSSETLSALMEQRRLKGVIALKGLPSTCKTEVGLRIGRWAKCPVLCIQDFLGEGAGFTYRFKGAEADFSPPTDTEEVERHHRKAFACLLAVALRHLAQGGWHCVVIKSSLNTPYELQQLLQLHCKNYECRIIIMECKIRNKFLWKLRFEQLFVDLEQSKSWCRPRSWKALDDAHHPPPWDHLHQHINAIADDHIYVAWLGIDPFYDLSLLEIFSKNHKPLSDEFNDAIKYLLTVPKQELPQHPYVDEYDEFRRFLFDLKLSAAALKGRTQSFCKGDCVFRYCQAPQEDYIKAGSCGVCQAEISRQPAYTCHYCVTTLDKTCAKRFPTRLLQSTIYDFFLYLKDHKSSKQHPCKACKVGGKEFSKDCRSCILQDRLKCHLFPTILNHNCHPHFLSIQLFKKDYRCKACGEPTFDMAMASYGCKRCAFNYHVMCAYLPLELKHGHGGHEHVMKLMYTRDAMEEEEDPIWCDCCYDNMDPELWFYACQQCPHYVVHLDCSGGYDQRLNHPKMAKFVEQLQSQLDDQVVQ